MEFRALDPVANPYLAYSVLLAAGLDGIDKQMQLGEPTSDDVWELTDGERQAMGIQPLPRSLDEALKIMEKSDFVADVRFLPNPFWVPNHALRAEEVSAEAVIASVAHVPNPVDDWSSAGFSMACRGGG